MHLEKTSETGRRGEYQLTSQRALMRSRRSMDAKIVGGISGEGQWMIRLAPPATAIARRERIKRVKERERYAH